jgi:hypothetical protein
VPIRPFLDRDDSFGPEDIAKMSAAFEATLGKLGLVDRSDPATMAVAKLIISLRKWANGIPNGCAPWRCSNYQSNRSVARASSRNVWRAYELPEWSPHLTRQNHG